MKSHRCVLEVLACLPPAFVANTAAFVCCQWSNIASEDELWQDFADAHSIDLSLLPGSSKKEKYCEVLFTTLSLPILTKKQLSWFNFTTKRWSFFAILDPIHVDFSSFLVNLKNCAILALGGSQPAYNKSAYIVTFGAVRQLADMEYGRKSPGAVLYGQAVYVFGGKDCLTSEKLSLETETWTLLNPLPNSQKEFAPCVYQTEIYLFGESPCSYSPLTDVYTLLPISCSLGGYSLFIDPDIVQLNSRFLSYVNIKSYKVRQKDFPSWGYSGICTQAAYHSESIWVTFNSAVFQMHLPSLSMTIHEQYNAS